MICNIGDGPETVFFNVRCFRWPCYSDSSHLKYLRWRRVQIWNFIFFLMAFTTFEHLVTPVSIQYEEPNFIRWKTQTSLPFKLNFNGLPSGLITLINFKEKHVGADFWATVLGSSVVPDPHPQFLVKIVSESSAVGIELNTFEY